VAVPIIFIHRGSSWYLWHTLRQARITNPESEILLVSDTFEPAWGAFARHVPIAAHFDEARRFASIYRHLSLNGYEYELFCFQRWFALQAVIEQHVSTPCVYLDSDVMVYDDLSSLQGRFSQFDLTVTRGKTPQNVFIRDRMAVARFCEFITDTYTRHTDQLAERFEVYRSQHARGGICDMTSFDDYRKQHPERVGEMFEISDGAIYDNNLNASEGFEMGGGIKRLFWRAGKPYGKHIESGALVRFHTLHFQGGAKMLIPHYASQRNLGYYMQFVLRTPPRTTARGIVRRLWR
jgi:hypothetical protein